MMPSGTRKRTLVVGDAPQPWPTPNVSWTGAPSAASRGPTLTCAKAGLPANNATRIDGMNLDMFAPSIDVVSQAVHARIFRRDTAHLKAQKAQSWIRCG